MIIVLNYSAWIFNFSFILLFLRKFFFNVWNNFFNALERELQLRSHHLNFLHSLNSSALKISLIDFLSNKLFYCEIILNFLISAKFHLNKNSYNYQILIFSSYFLVLFYLMIIILNSLDLMVPYKLSDCLFGSIENFY